MPERKGWCGNPNHTRHGWQCKSVEKCKIKILCKRGKSRATSCAYRTQNRDVAVNNNVKQIVSVLPLQ